MIFLTILVKFTFSFCQQIPYSTFYTDVIHILKTRVDLLNTIERTLSIDKRISIITACAMSSIDIMGSAKRIGSSASSSSHCIARVAFRTERGIEQFLAVGISPLESCKIQTSSVLNIVPLNTFNAISFRIVILQACFKLNDIVGFRVDPAYK